MSLDAIINLAERLLTSSSEHPRTRFLARGNREVNLTPANQSGQSLQVTAPQPAAAVTPQTSAPAAALSQSATA